MHITKTEVTSLSYSSDTLEKKIGSDKNQLYCNCIDGSGVNGKRQPEF